VSVYLNRNAKQPGNSNTLAPEPSSGPFSFYEKTYSSGTNQEAIYLPDMQGASVTLTISSGSGSIQGTDSPPDIIEAGTASWVSWSFGTVSATQGALVTGYTAIRAVLASGSVKISVRV
jgi:hypothetical protein